MEYQINIDSHIGAWGVSKGWIKDQMSSLKGKDINVRISSLGGSVADALDIRQQFIDHGAVACYIYGFTASAATIICTGATKVKMSKYAFFLIHKVSNWVDAWGTYNADQLEKLIEDLKANKLENDKMDLVLAAMYAKKTGKTINEILPVLKAGKWMNAKEAFDLGLVDEIIEDGEKLNFTPSIAQKFNMMHLPALPSIDEEQQKEDKKSFDEEGFFTRLGKFFNGKKNDVPEDPNSTVTTQTDNTQKSGDMKKDYVKVNSILNVEGIEFNNDGKCTLTEEQVKALNQKIDELEKSNKESSDKVTELTTQVENLKKADGDDTTKVEGEEQEVSSDVAQQMYNVFNSYM